MKRYMTALFLVATVFIAACGNSDGAILIYNSNGTYSVSTATDTLEEAATAATVAGKTVVVTSPQTLTANVIWPADRVLKIEKGGIITTTGYTLAINGPFAAGLHQVFTGTGAVTFGVGVVESLYPEWWGAKVNSGIDATLAIQRMAAAAAQNVSKIVFSRGTYLVFSTATGTLVSLSGLSGMKIEGYGTTLEVLTSKTITSSEGYFFYLSGCTNITIDGFRTNGPVLDVSTTTVKGYEFVRCVNGCKNIRIPNSYIENSLAGFITSKLVTDPDDKRSSNIYIGNMYIKNCFYGINSQWSGDDMTVDNLQTDTIHRSVFIYGVSNVKINVKSKDHKSVDVPITTAQGVACKNIEINYQSGVDSVNCGGAAKVQIGFSGNTASIAKDIKVNLNVEYNSTGNTGGAALLIRKTDDSGASDLLDRGHKMENVTISGSIKGHGSYGGDGSTTMALDVNCVWGAGDYFSKISFSNLVINSGATSGAALFRSSGFTDIIELKNVTSDQSISFQHSATEQRLPHNAEIVLSGVVCANRYIYDSAAGVGPLNHIRTNGITPDSVYIGWTGKTITNEGIDSDMVWNLPPAVIGLSYGFIRTAGYQLSINPDGSEIIRGGTTGQQLNMNTAGNYVELKCFTTGVWEIVRVQGAYTFS